MLSSTLSIAFLRRRYRRLSDVEHLVLFRYMACIAQMKYLIAFVRTTRKVEDYLVMLEKVHHHTVCLFPSYFLAFDISYLYYVKLTCIFIVAGLILLFLFLAFRRFLLLFPSPLSLFVCFIFLFVSFTHHPAVHRCYSTFVRKCDKFEYEISRRTGSLAPRCTRSFRVACERRAPGDVGIGRGMKGLRTAS